jgi:hypothetical protein
MEHVQKVPKKQVQAALRKPNCGLLLQHITCIAASQKPARTRMPIAASWQGLSRREMDCTALCSCMRVRCGLATKCLTTIPSRACSAFSPEPWKTAGVIAAEVTLSLLLGPRLTRMPDVPAAAVLLLLVMAVVVWLHACPHAAEVRPRGLLALDPAGRLAPAAVCTLPLLTVLMLPSSFGAKTPLSTSLCQLARASGKAGSVGRLTQASHLGRLLGCTVAWSVLLLLWLPVACSALGSVLLRCATAPAVFARCCCWGSRPASCWLLPAPADLDLACCC